MDWYLLGEEKHQQFQHYVKTLLHLYKEDSAMYSMDRSWEGFEWINADDNTRSLYSFIRHSADGKSNLVFAINFTPVARESYRVGVPQSGVYKLVLNSDEKQYGGNGGEIPVSIRAKKGKCDGKPYYLEFDLPAYGTAVFRYAKRVQKTTSAKKTGVKKTGAKKTSAKKR